VSRRRAALRRAPRPGRRGVLPRGLPAGLGRPDRQARRLALPSRPARTKVHWVHPPPGGPGRIRRVDRRRRTAPPRYQGLRRDKAPAEVVRELP